MKADTLVFPILKTKIIPTQPKTKSKAHFNKIFRGL